MTKPLTALGVLFGFAAACQGRPAVFSFRSPNGGVVTTDYEFVPNVDRWVAQFVGAPNPVRKRLTVQGLDVTRVEIQGTYLDPGSDMRSKGQLKNWMVLGAIAVGPRGPVFFKLTGPAHDVRQASVDFDGMLSTLAPR